MKEKELGKGIHVREWLKREIPPKHMGSCLHSSHTKTNMTRIMVVTLYNSQSIRPSHSPWIAVTKHHYSPITSSAPNSGCRQVHSNLLKTWSKQLCKNLCSESVTFRDTTGRLSHGVSYHSRAKANTRKVKSILIQTATSLEKYEIQVFPLSVSPPVIHI
jgi:hypothetical protein